MSRTPAGAKPMAEEDKQLALISPQSVMQPECEALSPGLKKLLTQGDDSGGACRLIALNRTLRAECERMLPMLEMQKAPAERADVLEIIARRMVAYGVTENLAFQHGVRWDSYVAGLAGMPANAIEDAFDRWDRGEGTGGNMTYAGLPPRPPQLALLAQVGKTEIWTAAYRAKKALDHVEKEAQHFTPEQRAAERQKMIEAGYLNADGSPNLTLSAKAMPEPHRPRHSPSEVAAQLRATDAAARHGGAPISRKHIEPDDVGDVL